MTPITPDVTSVVILDFSGHVIDTQMNHDLASFSIGQAWSSVTLSNDIDVETIVLTHFVLKLLRLKHVDVLTGARQRVDLRKDIAACSETLFALAMFDMNRLKQVNDTEGHLAGDALLQTFVADLGLLFRQTDRVYRWGGDEFVVLLPQVSNVTDLSAIISRIDAVIGKRAAYGLAHVSELEEKDNLAEALLSLADQRMYEHKKA